jgi:predicted secreted hydrolase
LSIAVLLSTVAWRQATPGYTFSFPRDHASHPDYQIEWWYYTGNVTAAGGRRFGYQVTFFRVGIDRAPANPSRWALRDLFITHLAVSDPAGQRYRYAERLNRGGPGLAGAEVDRYYVWNEEWTAGIERREPRAGSRGPHRLRASGDRAGIDLVLEEGKPPVVHGVNGISQKGAEPGNASHYYSLTRMPTGGTIRIDGETIAVTGESWMDHEFGTSFLERDQQGWDWLSIQLADGTELMLYQMRRADGRRDAHSSGSFVDRAGRQTHLGAEAFRLTPTGPTYRSGGRAAYPIAWKVAVPALQLDLQVTTPLANQELSLLDASGVAYWEGLIDVTGTRAGRPVAGRGYLEMTGYRGSMGRLLSGR